VLVSRAQLALNVADLAEAVAFYTKLFATEPAKLRPGYANFAIADPPLKLVLIENHDPAAGPLNHLGVEVTSTDEVSSAQDRWVAAGLSVEAKDQATCCYALQDKIWAHGPGGQSWELYTVLADSETPDGQPGAAAGTEPTCCGAALPAAAAGTCC
jgi:catechol 2,3-dioxygenase-like lactoylglutathione lyase family enzyme